MSYTPDLHISLFSLTSQGFYWIKCDRFFRRVYSESYSHKGEEEKSRDYAQHGNPTLQKTFGYHMGIKQAGGLNEVEQAFF